MSFGDGTELAKVSCFQGHSWDAWGSWEEAGSAAAERFFFEDERCYFCPTCDGFAAEVEHPVRLA